MYDLIGSYTRLEEIYRMYIKSAFPLRNQALSKERDNLLKQIGEAGSLSQVPLLETVPVYPSSNRTLADAADELPSEYSDLRFLAQKLFEPHIQLYEHQWESLKSAIVDKKDIVVTTGTGSGKTESFLLPLLAQVAYESSKWEPCDPPPDQQRYWWKHKGSRNDMLQWKHVNREPALRGIILYPLNALVEDQLRRLRSALDHEKVHTWLDNHRGRNRVTFGRYTSLTPVPGERNNTKLTRLRRELQTMERQYHEMQKQLAKPEVNDDLEWYFPNPAGAEMWSRWDMQVTPPDILITNYSMLNIMMMRSIENDIFDKTRKWLAEPGHPERVFHLIIDELHAYRGTPGTEVAYIIRLLLYRLGLTPDSPKLRILTTTASLNEDDPESEAFLRQFFGRDPSRFKVIAGEQTPPQPGSSTQLSPYTNAFAQFAEELQKTQPNPRLPINIASNAVRQQIDLLTSQLPMTVDANRTAEEQLGQALTGVRVDDALREACQIADLNRNGSGTIRPAKVTDLDRILFRSAIKSNGNQFSHAMQGFLLALAISQNPEIGRSPQPVRGHFFFHNLQNLWACTNPNCSNPNCNHELSRKVNVSGEVEGVK